MRALVLSDLHIEDKSRWSTTDQNEDLEFLLEQLKSMSEETFDVDCILVCGDTTDRPRENANVVKHLQRLFEAVNPNKRPVYVINGNHDTGKDNYLTAVCGATHVGGQQIKVKDKTIAFLDYTNNLDAAREFLKTATADILVIHQSSAPFIGLKIEDLPILHVEDYPDNNLCFVGDTHIAGIYTDKNKFIVSPGTLYPHNKTEIINEDNYLITLDTDNLQEPVKAVMLEKRPGIALESKKSVESIKSSVEKFLTSESRLRPIIWVPDFMSDVYKTDDRAIFKFVATYSESPDVGVDQVDTLDILQVINASLDLTECHNDKVREAAFNIIKTFAETDDPYSVDLDGSGV